MVVICCSFDTSCPAAAAGLKVYEAASESRASRPARKLRAVNEPSRSFTVPKEAPYSGLLLVEIAY